MTVSSTEVERHERDRQERLAELEADGGPDWAKEFTTGSFGQHELLDRTSMLADMVERFLVEHPACVLRPDWFRLATAAATALHELYQRVGAEGLDADGAGT